ncbi:MAG TPA: HDOD domain-containing protein [Desulfobacterales bacterium]|nr:HDOD domain-containing protein [Desulfobacterales bacterium]
MSREAKIFDKIKSSKSLPSLPQVLLKLIELCNREEATPGELAAVIRSDPAISVKVMQLVSSAHMGLLNKPGSLEQAVVYLGAGTVKNIALCAAVVQVFRRVKGGPGFNLARFWWHSLMCAATARRLAGCGAAVPPEEAFLAGLLHDIGKLLLWVHFRSDYGALLQAADSGGQGLLAAEARLGATHCAVGAWAIRQWGLDSLMADAVYYHHEGIDRIGDALPLVQIVYAANALSQGPQADPAAGRALCERLLGLAPERSEALVGESLEEVQETARALGMAVEAPPASWVAEPSPEDAPQEVLSYEVRDASLLVGTLDNLLRAEDTRAILLTVQRALKILFDVRQAAIFLHDPAANRLVGRRAAEDPLQQHLDQQVLPLTNGKGLLIRALTRNVMLDSFGCLSSEKASIADEQVIRALGTEGMLCLPLAAGRQRVGVMALGLSEAQFRRLTGRIKLLGMFARQAAACLHLDGLKTRQGELIQAQRIEAAAVLARRVAHEANNPLGIIKNYLAILEPKLGEDHPAVQELGIIREEIDRVAQIVRQLSDFSTPAIRATDSVDINGLILDLIKVIEPSLLAPLKIAVHLDLAESLAPVAAERNALKQVLINLVKNAAEAMARGGNLFLATRRLGPAKNAHGPIGEAEISVCDDGPGLPLEVQARIFEPFNSAKGGGHAGLGLSIVHGIVRSLGGRVSCRSRQGRGTCFTVRLPLA